MTEKNIFVLGLTDVQRRELETVRHAEEYTFRGVLDYEQLVNTTDFDFEELLRDARRELDAARGDPRVYSQSWERRIPRDLV